jgi:hypothetical protein
MPKQDNIGIASAINISDAPATVLLPAADLRALLQEVRSLRTEFDALDADLKRFKVCSKTGLVDAICDDIFKIEGRLAKLEGRHANPGQTHEARLAKLDRLLLSRRNEAMTFSEIGKVLELGSRTEGKNTRRQAMTKFSKNLDPSRYEIFSAKSQNGKMVKLAKAYYDHLRAGVVSV